ncbi:Hypothetical predicted protein [Podarcis lilfordi]|uniref:Uncharacterized protein n=1 Tax=Podarcis lilfordi TaxID=74358 RepID=A0AA35P496_9SAUR|nr:Hypothetical predicted protein [Podarcis lilfordi]
MASSSPAGNSIWAPLTPRQAGTHGHSLYFSSLWWIAAICGHSGHQDRSYSIREAAGMGSWQPKLEELHLDF